MKEKYLTVKEFAYLSGISSGTVYSAVKQNKVKYKMEPMGLREIVLIPESELRKFKKT